MTTWLLHQEKSWKAVLVIPSFLSVFSSSRILPTLIERSMDDGFRCIYIGKWRKNVLKTLIVINIKHGKVPGYLSRLNSWNDFNKKYTFIPEKGLIIAYLLLFTCTYQKKLVINENCGCSCWTGLFVTRYKNSNKKTDYRNWTRLKCDHKEITSFPIKKESSIK